MLNAWFSEKAAYRNGSCLYKTPSCEIVECTEVSEGNKPAGLWDDAVSVGPVTKCIRQMSCPFCKSTKHHGMECPHEDKVIDKLEKINDPKFSRVVMLLRALREHGVEKDYPDADL